MVLKIARNLQRRVYLFFKNNCKCFAKRAIEINESVNLEMHELHF